MKTSTIKKWTKALRSGKYKQATGALQTNEGFCCLGVACKVFIPEGKLMIDQDTGNLNGGLPAGNQPYAPQWLDDINFNLSMLTGIQVYQLNDHLGMNFDEIADVLEAVYIHKVLE